jgi:hypothetical protein
MGTCVSRKKASPNGITEVYSFLATKIQNDITSQQRAEAAPKLRREVAKQHEKRNNTIDLRNRSLGKQVIFKVGQ